MTRELGLERRVRWEGEDEGTGGGQGLVGHGDTRLNAVRCHRGDEIWLCGSRSPP